MISESELRIRLLLKDIKLEGCIENLLISDLPKRGFDPEIAQKRQYPWRLEGMTCLAPVTLFQNDAMNWCSLLVIVHRLGMRGQ